MAISCPVAHNQRREEEGQSHFEPGRNDGDVEHYPEGDPGRKTDGHPRHTGQRNWSGGALTAGVYDHSAAKERVHLQHQRQVTLGGVEPLHQGVLPVQFLPADLEPHIAGGSNG